ncbi:MAG: energy transducer TonB [Verrucomicrobiota bacterium]
MTSLYKPPQGKGTFAGGTILGIAASGLLFLAIPLTQIFKEFTPPEDEIFDANWAPPPPPPLEEDPPEPPEPEEEPPPPELVETPPPLTLEQLDLALNPGKGGSLTGDFALPTFDLAAQDLGGLEIFDIGDLETKPQPRKQGAPRYPATAKRKGLQGFALAEFIIDENGNVIDVEIKQSSDPIFEKPTVEAIRDWKFTPGEKDGRAVKTRTRVKIPYNIT